MFNRLIIALFSGWMLIGVAQAALDLVDPTVPQLERVGQVDEEIEKSKIKKDVRLNGVMIGKSRRVAVIDGRVYRVGSMVENFMLQEIRQGMVVLVDGENEIELRVGGSVKKSGGVMKRRVRE